MVDRRRVAGALPLALALTQGALELAAVAAALLVGTAYSVPPARLKRFAIVASLCVSGVRSAIVNLGVAAHFTSALGDGGATIPPGVWALTAFVLPFSLAIAILKDVPDAEGDRAHRIATFTVRHGGRAVLRAGLAVLTLAYLGMAILGPLLDRRRRPRAARGRPPGGARGALVGGPERRSLRPRRVHALLHAGVAAVLPGIRHRSRFLFGRIGRSRSHRICRLGVDKPRRLL